MKSTDEDHRRLLLSRSSSADDLEALASPAANGPSQLKAMADSASDTDTIFVEHKSPKLHNLYKAMTGRRYAYLCSLRLIRYLVTFLVLTIVLFFTYTLWPKDREIALSKWAPTTEEWVKPTSFKIIGMVFYGRPQYVSILDCYLKRNLAVNGGYLDEVHWMANTENDFDLQFLDDLVKTTDSYKKFVVDEHSFGNVWHHATGKNTMYIKIDDDIVYIHDDAIPRIVHTKLNHPEAFDIAANIINSPLTNWFHARTGAIHAYLPEPRKPSHTPESNNSESWRASELPEWYGKADDEYDFGHKEEDQDEIEVGKPGGPTYEGHRWLPLKDTQANFMKTPMAHSEYNAWGRGWSLWPIAAQQHYSLFENLEKNQMEKYRFGNDEGIWSMQYERYNLNFLAVWGRDIAQNPIEGGDDEQDYTVEIPKKLKRPLLIDTHALVAHFSFGIQHELRHTDLLSRYRAYANEMVCGADNQLEAIEEHDE